MFADEILVRAEHHYRAEQLKKIYPRRGERRRRRLGSPRAESRWISFKERKAW